MNATKNRRNLRTSYALLLSLLLIFTLFPYAAIAQTEPEVKEDQLVPTLEIGIPTVKFSDVTVSTEVDDAGKVTYRELDVPFIAEYLAGVYKYAVGIAGALAAVMMMIGGFQYLTAGGDAARVGAAKKRITDAFIGLMLTLGVYVMLFTINPDLVTLEGLKVKYVAEKLYEPPPEAEDDSVTGRLATTFRPPVGENISGGGKSKVPTDLSPKIEAAAEVLLPDGYGMSIASSFRPIETQIRLIYQNCQNPPGSASCSPKPGKPQTCILKNNDPANCPHTTGRALDVWATKKNESGSYSVCINQTNCLADKAACFANECQAKLISAMKAQGFCVLNSEPWHFEQPKMSRGCN